MIAGEVKRPVRGHPAHEIRAFHLRNRARLVDERLRIELAAGHDHAAHDAARAQLPRQRARVDVGDRDDLVCDQVVAQRAFGAPVARDRRLFTHDESRDVRCLRLAVVVGDAVVADFRGGHGDDLSRVRRIGEHFLVAGHARVEHDLAGGMTARARGDAAEPGSVFQGKNGFFIQVYFSSDAVTRFCSPAEMFTPAVQMR